MRDLRLIFHKNPVFDECTNCGEVASLHRSRARGMFEQFVKKFTFYRIYRCKKCGWRGYRSTLAITKQSFKNLFFYIILAGITAFIIKFVLQKFIK